MVLEVGIVAQEREGKGRDWKRGMKGNLQSHRCAHFVTTHQAVSLCFEHNSECMLYFNQRFILKKKERKATNTMGESFMNCLCDRGLYPGHRRNTYHSTTTKTTTTTKTSQIQK